VIAEYRRLLQKEDLPRKDEIRLRKELGKYYLHVIHENSEYSQYISDDYKVAHQFLRLAKKEYEKILSYDPNDPEAHFGIGQILLNQKLEASGLKELELGIKGMPGNPYPLQYVSRIHQERGEANLGLDYALRAMAVDASNNENRDALVTAYVLLEEEEKALAEFQKLSATFQALPEVKARHAILLAKMNFWNEAEEEMKDVLSRNPNDGRIRMAYGEMLLDQGKADEAAGQFFQAADLMPHYILPLVWQARAYAQRGRCPEVTRVAQTLELWAPRWAWTHLINADALLCEGKDRAADKSLAEALRLSPDFPEARTMQVELLLDRGQFSELGPTVRPWLDEKLNEGEAIS
jgi:tetratricopeptide (TPR) repeat protein